MATIKKIKIRIVSLTQTMKNHIYLRSTTRYPPFSFTNDDLNYLMDHHLKDEVFTDGQKISIKQSVLQETHMYRNTHFPPQLSLFAGT